jgi:hypothetical protein
VPPKVNPFMCDEDSDIESVSDDSDDSDEDSGSNSDTSYVEADPSSSNLSGESSSMEVDPPLQPDEDDLSVLTAQNAGKWCREWLSSVNSQKLIMTRWRDSLRDYLLCAETSEVSYILIIIWCILTINSRLLKPVWVRGSKQLSHHFWK